MEINLVGSSILCTRTTEIHLKNILHVPKASEILISVNPLTRDNNVFFRISPQSFFFQGTGDEEDSPQRQM
jgi:hypothetical protein